MPTRPVILHAAFLAFDDDPASRVAVFHGAHGHFCAGWDLQAGARLHAAGVDGKALTHLDWAPDAERPLGPMGPSRLLLSKPVIAAVSGAAVAGGMELALWCDLRVMEADAYFGVYCRRFGVPLIDGGTVRLPRLIGMGHAMDLILTGRKVEAEEALRIGLCNRVAPPGQGIGDGADLGAAAGGLSAGDDERRPPERLPSGGPAIGSGAATGVGRRAGLPGRCAGRRGPFCRWRGPAWKILIQTGTIPARNGHHLLLKNEFSRADSPDGASGGAPCQRASNRIRAQAARSAGAGPGRRWPRRSATLRSP
jgi:enoyl-CoA hydratase/carnithine racemase